MCSACLTLGHHTCAVQPIRSHHVNQQRVLQYLSDQLLQPFQQSIQNTECLLVQLYEDIYQGLAALKKQFKETVHANQNVWVAKL